MLQGAAACLYLGLLWCAAPILRESETSAAARIRNAIIIGAGVPGVLGLLHLLFAPLVWLVLLILAVLGSRQRRPLDKPDPQFFMMIAVAAVAVWPALCRPLLEGDSLAYHLPNAASWVQHHSVWTASAPYWYYPPGSELFAAGLLSAVGQWTLPLAGVVPALLLSARLYDIARRNGAPAYAAMLVPLAFILTPVVGLEVGTLANDVWLAALFVEVLTANNGLLATALCVLLKPFGWIEACIAAIAARRSFYVVALAFVPLVVWIIRDVVLLRDALPIAGGTYWQTTILANIPRAFVDFIVSVGRHAPQMLLEVAAVAVGLWIAPVRRYSLAALAATVLFVILPFSYAYGTDAYLQLGTSLRYLMPGFAAGAVIVAFWAARVPKTIALICGALAVLGAVQLIMVFHSDSVAIAAPIVVAALLASLLARSRRAVTFAAVSCITVMTATHFAQDRAPSFYADWMKDSAGRPTAVFTWLAAHAPARIVAQNLRGGAVIMVSPGTLTLSDVAVPDVCGLARKYSALLLVGTNESWSETEINEGRAQAKACGVVEYEDGSALIVRPN